VAVRDGAFELFDWDPRTGVSVWRAYDGEKYVYRTDTPFDPGDNQRAQAQVAGQRWREGVGERVAEIPLNVVYEQLGNAAREKDTGYIKRFLNDSDNAKFRVKEGRL